LKRAPSARTLYYRLNVIELRMPPLRDCREDIEAIAAGILARLGAQAGVTPRLAAAALQQLQGYDFPGNVRELENILERAIALSAGGEIGVDDLRLLPLGTEEAAAGAQAGELPAGPLPAYLDKVEREGDSRGVGEDGLQSHRGSEAAWPHFPNPALPDAEAGHQGTGLRMKEGGWVAGARRVLSPNCDSRPAGTGISLAVLHSISLPRGRYRKRGGQRR
jgi:hypothetical protein